MLLALTVIRVVLFPCNCLYSPERDVLIPSAFIPANSFISDDTFSLCYCLSTSSLSRKPQSLLYIYLAAPESLLYFSFKNAVCCKMNNACFKSFLNSTIILPQRRTSFTEYNLELKIHEILLCERQRTWCPAWTQLTKMSFLLLFWSIINWNVQLQI